MSNGSDDISRKEEMRQHEAREHFQPRQERAHVIFIFRDGPRDIKFEVCEVRYPFSEDFEVRIKVLGTVRAGDTECQRAQSVVQEKHRSTQEARPRCCPRESSKIGKNLDRRTRERELLEDRLA